MKLKLHHALAFVVTIILIVIPFFWFRPGEMDLGGDSNRLYFYSPISFLFSTSSSVAVTEGLGGVGPNYFYIPFVGFLALLKYIGVSSTNLISIINAMKIGIGFIATYLIVMQLIKTSCKTVNRGISIISSVISGLFYISSFGSLYMEQGWNRAITSHNQVFINPFMFYLLLLFMTRNNFTYLLIAILFSFLFSPNFAITSAPPFFAFYPMAIICIVLYAKIVLKKEIPWKGLLFGGLLFIGVQAFHLLPQIVSLFDKGSFANSRMFNPESLSGAEQYFVGTLGFGKASLSLLLPPEAKTFQFLSVVAPLVLILGFMQKGAKKSLLFLVSVFFFLTMFLSTANITNIGVDLYRRLFYIPGFSMFRNYNTQWLFSYIFYYSILFGLATYTLFVSLKTKLWKLFAVIMCSVVVILGLPVFSGRAVTKNEIRRSGGVSTLIRMDPKYEETLEYIRQLPDDGKILVLPLTDFFYQVISGTNGGLYEGPSTLYHLTGKYGFVGYQSFGYYGNYTISEEVMRLSREHDYAGLVRLLQQINVRYILHNSDETIYNEKVTPGPYGYMQTSLPKTQSEYKSFLANFPLKIIYQNGPYSIYSLETPTIHPTIFIPEAVEFTGDDSFRIPQENSVLVNRSVCRMPSFRTFCSDVYRSPDVNVGLRMLTPSKYAVTVTNNESDKQPLFIVMQHSFHGGWRAIVDNRIIGKQAHIPVNWYANGWYFHADELPNRNTYTIYFELESQKYFFYGIAVTIFSLATVFGLLGWFVRSNNEIHA